MIQELKNITAKLWWADCCMHLLFGILVMPAFLFSMNASFAMNDDYGQTYAAEHDIISPAYWVDTRTEPNVNQNWYIYYNHLRRRVYTQIFAFNDLKTASPYAEEMRELPFVLLPADLIEVEVLPGAPLTRSAMAYFILYQTPHTQETLVFHNNVVTDSASAHIANLVTYRMEQPTLIWRNWHGNAVLPATRIILTVWRQTADRGQIGDSLNLSLK